MMVHGQLSRFQLRHIDQRQNPYPSASLLAFRLQAVELHGASFRVRG